MFVWILTFIWFVSADEMDHRDVNHAMSDRIVQLRQQKIQYGELDIRYGDIYGYTSLSVLHYYIIRKQNAILYQTNILNSNFHLEWIKRFQWIQSQDRTLLEPPNSFNVVKNSEKKKLPHVDKTIDSTLEQKRTFLCVFGDFETETTHTFHPSPSLSFQSSTLTPHTYIWLNSVINQFFIPLQLSSFCSLVCCLVVS
jgi:hypothetical protein